MEFLFYSLQAVAVARAGAKLGDVKAGCMGHVDHESVRENRKLILLKGKKLNQYYELIWHFLISCINIVCETNCRRVYLIM